MLHSHVQLHVQSALRILSEVDSAPVIDVSVSVDPQNLDSSLYLVEELLHSQLHLAKDEVIKLCT